MLVSQSNRVLFFWLALVTAMLVACSTARREPAELGMVEFPTTCSSQAQSHFTRGLAALHSFWYPVALEEFRAATRIDPNCMMGYWGEAMAHNHPIWGDPQETEAARKVIEKIKITPELTPRERAYLDAVKVLYSVGISRTGAAHHKGNLDAAIEILEKAAAMIDAMPPPPGPPPLIKPVHELFGEILLRAGQPEKAASQFAISLSRHPNRARSLLGAARAAAKSGKAKNAARFYARFAQQWQHAEAELPEMREARNYLDQARAR